MAAGRTAPKQGNRVTLNGEICQLTQRGKLFRRNTNIDIDDAMAGSTGQVMMMFVAAYTIAMRTIGKFDAIKQTSINQHFN